MRTVHSNGMPSTTPRIQVTVDAELEEALRGTSRTQETRSRSRLVRDLAVRGAQAVKEEQRARHAAIAFLLSEHVDFSELRNIDEERRERLLPP